MYTQNLHGIEGHADTSTTLGKALEIIRLLSITPGTLGTRETARLTGIDKSAVSRLLGQLEKHGWAERNPDNDRYRPGQALHAVGASVRSNDDVWSAARDQLVSLNDKYNETVYLTSRIGDSILFREKLETTQSLRYVVDLGVLFPLISGGASATAVLSVLSESERTRLLKGGLRKYTDNSIVDPGEFRRILDEDRRNGYSFSFGRWAENGGGVASPYFNATGACLGTITLSSPLTRLVEMKVEEIGSAVRHAARLTSLRLGYQSETRNWDAAHVDSNVEVQRLNRQTSMATLREG